MFAPRPATSLDIIMQVMDPDQSGRVSIEEWLDFMLSTEENLEAITLTTEHTINSINATKSVVTEEIVTIWIDFGLTLEHCTNSQGEALQNESCRSQPQLN